MGEPALRDLLPGDRIDGSLLEHDRLEVRRVRREGAGIDARSATDIEKPPPANEDLRDRIREFFPEKHAPAIHRRGEGAGEVLRKHRAVPVVRGFVQPSPMGGTTGFQNPDIILHDGTVAERTVVGGEVPDRTLTKMLQRHL